MNTIKARAYDFLSAKDENCQFLTSRIIWDGNLERVEKFRNRWKDILAKLVQDTYFDPNFKRDTF
jgi:hypothetical protein